MIKVSLGSLLNFRRGYDLPKKDFQTGDIPVISSSGIMGYHNELKAASPALTIGRSGSVGRPFFLNSDFFPHNTALFVDDFKGNDPKYLFYLIESINLDDWKSGTGVPTLNRNHLHPIKVPAYKNIEDQKQIAKVLSDLDAKIEVNNQINQQLEAMAKTLYDYWFVQFDFPYVSSSDSRERLDSTKTNHNVKPYKSSGGKMVYHQELKREIPDGWESNLLGEIGNFKNGVNYDPSQPGEVPCPIINVRNISASSYFLKNEDLDTVYLNQSDVDKYAVHEGSIIIARSGIPGATRLITDFDDNTLYCGFAIHYQLEDLDLKIPIFFFLKSIEEIIKTGSGGTILKNVNQATLNMLKIALPKDLGIIKAFNNKIHPMFQRINLIQKENQKLTELRDWLLPMLMNGQVSVENLSLHDKPYDAGVAGEGLGMVAEGGIKYGKLKNKNYGFK